MKKTADVRVLVIELQESAVMFTIKRKDDGQWEEVEVLFNYWGCGAVLLGLLTAAGVIALVIF